MHSFTYWGIFFLFFFTFYAAIKPNFLDPIFQIILYLSFTTAATSQILFINPEFLFLNLSILLSIYVGWKLNHFALKFTQPKSSTTSELNETQGYFALFFITIYIVTFIISKNLLNNPLGLILGSITDSAAARKENILLTIMGFSAAPLFGLALASINKNKSLIVLVGATLIIVLSLAGSKIGGVGIILTSLAAFYYKGGVLGIRGIAIITLLISSFPIIIYTISPELFGGNGEGLKYLFERILYRLVASNDQLALSIESNINLSSYPYSGPLQLVDPFLKLLGLRNLGFEFSVGEWIYGQAFGIWDGVGPNPSYILEAWLGLGFFSPIFFLPIGFFLRYIKYSKNTIVFGLYTVSPIFFIDISLFHMTAISYLFFALICLISSFSINYITQTLKYISLKPNN
jgi:hypothetical protein